MAVMARMSRHCVRHLPVLDGDRLCGIVCIGDVIKHLLDELEMETNILRGTLMITPTTLPSLPGETRRALFPLPTRSQSPRLAPLPRPIG